MSDAGRGDRVTAGSTLRAPRPDASMTLLREVNEHPLDPAYEDAARRRALARARGERNHRSWLSHVVVAALAIALGVGLAVAARTLRSPTGVRNQARELLIAQIVERRETHDELTAANADLTAEIGALSAELLEITDPALAAQLERLGVVSAVTPVAGEAFVVTLSDSAQAAADPSSFPEERVQATDLQLTVNALWAGGAEAVAINGTRVGGVGAIRGAGSAILIDHAPVSSPYEVVAIGPVDAIRTSLARSTLASQFAVLRDRYHLGITTGTRENAWLPGVRTTQLTFAEPIGDASQDAGVESGGQTGDTDPGGEEGAQ